MSVSENRSFEKQSEAITRTCGVFQKWQEGLPGGAPRVVSCQTKLKSRKRDGLKIQIIKIFFPPHLWSGMKALRDQILILISHSSAIRFYSAIKFDWLVEKQLLYSFSKKFSHFWSVKTGAGKHSLLLDYVACLLLLSFSHFVSAQREDIMSKRLIIALRKKEILRDI